MDRIGEIVPRIVSDGQLKPSTTNDRQEQRKRAAAVWVALAELFGSKVTSQWGETPPPRWCAVVAQLTDAQLSTGLQRIEDSGREWPPTAPEFKRECRYRQNRPPHLRDDAVYVPASHQLADTGRRARAVTRWEQEMQKLREVLPGLKVQSDDETNST